jgi:hypothetical protein
MKRLISAVVALGLFSVFVVFAGAQPPRSRTIHVTVTDAEGLPITAVSAGDLTVVENGVNRPVQSVSAGVEPIMLGLAFDDRALLATPVRDSLRAFVSAMSGKATIGLFSYSRPDWTIQDFTPDAGTVGRAIDALAPLPAVSNDAEGLLQTLARRLKKQEAARPVLLALTFGASNCVPKNCPSASTPRWDIVLEDILKSRATVYTVGTNPIEPAHLLYASVEATGGTVERPLTSSSDAIAQAMRHIADQILSQVAVTYTTTDAPKSGFKVKVSTTRPGLHVRAPQKVY